MNDKETPKIDKAKETSNELVVNNDNLSWVNSGSFDKMMSIATDMVKSSLVPFKKPEDAVMAWQFGRDIGLTFTQSMSELYAIPSKDVTRISAGIHIHEAILLKHNVRYEVVEDAVEVQHYKIQGLGNVVHSMKEMMELVDKGTYQIVTAEDYSPERKLIVEKTGKYLAYAFQCPYLVEGVEDMRTSIRFIRKDKEVDAVVQYCLSDAAKAGYLSKDNWMRMVKVMLYTACFRIGSRRYGSDLLKNLGELTETLHYSNVPHSYSDDGKVTFDAEYDDVSEEDAEGVETEIIELKVVDNPTQE